MAKCEKGYLCVVCGSEVEELSDSELYLRYTVGWLDPERLHIAPERHLTCNPALAQFIDAEKFANILVSGDSDKRKLDPNFVAQRTMLLTRGYQRLLEIQHSAVPVPITDYPLAEALPNYRKEKPKEG